MRINERRPWRRCALAAILQLVATISAGAGATTGTVAAATVRAGDVTFTNDGHSLQGTVLRPQAGGPFPAFVLLHGSGCSTREEMRPLAEQLVARGYVTLIFDERGCGRSAGDWTAASLTDLSGDAEAALATLARQPDVDAARLGLWATSQSGWLAPIVATRADRVRFLVIVTGGGASPREVELFGHDQRLRHFGSSLAANPAATALLDSYFAYLATGENRAALEQAIEAAKQQQWYAALRLDKVLPSDASRAAWAWVANYDPLTDIRRIRVPTLILLGGMDDLTPTALSAQRWTAGLQEAHAPGSQVVIFPGAGHGLTVGGHHRPAAAREYARGFLPTVGAWLETLAAAAPAK